MDNIMYKEILRKNKIVIIVTVVLSIFNSGMYVYAGYALSFLFKDYDKNMKWTLLIKNAFMVLLIWICTLTIMYIYSVLQQKVVCKMKNDLRELMAYKIISMDCEDYSQRDTGNYLSWMTNDVEQISKQVFYNLFGIVEAVGQTVFSLFALFYLGIGIGITAIILFAFMAVVPQLAAKGLEQKNEIMSKESEVATEKYKEYIGGYILFYLSNRQNYFVNQMKNISQRQEDAVFKKERKAVSVDIAGASISLLSQIVMIVVTIGMSLIGTTQVGAVLSVGNLGQTFFSNVGSSVEAIITAKSSKKIWEKYRVDKRKQIGKEITKANKSIKVSHLNYSYDTRKVISNINFEFLKGKNYAIIGESGAGKTTLGKILSGMIKNYEGSVKFDDLELSQITKTSLFNYITYVDQNVYIFGESIRFNITLGKNFPDDVIWSVLERCNLDKFVNNLEGRLEYVLEEGGRNLSGGQRQRLALARALIRNVSYIILDEGTSALDRKSAIQIEDALLSDTEVCVIIISHHLSESTICKLDGSVLL